MLHLGLLITKDDDEIISEWLAANCRYFDGLVCLDGSCSSLTCAVAGRHANVFYVHESSITLEWKTDHGLRAAAHDILLREFGADCWVTLCHADEYFYHNPRLCCEMAEDEGSSGIYWFAVHFLPHPNDLVLWPVLRHLPIRERYRYYHWDFGGTGLPWTEFRSYRNSQDVRWRPELHGNTQPAGCDRLASFSPIYRHFKVYSIELDKYEIDGSSTRLRHHWSDLGSGRTGVSWVVRKPEDLFVSQFGVFQQCNYFRDTFDHSWNIGDHLR